LIDLLDAMAGSKLYPREHFDHQFKVYLYPALVENFKREFSFREKVLYQFAVSLKSFGSMDPTLWDMWVDKVVGIKRIQDINDFHKFLHMLMWCNEDPKSPQFGKITNKIELFKDQVRNNPNRLWKYNPDVRK
jgi:hypothetical protein